MFPNNTKLYFSFNNIDIYIHHIRNSKNYSSELRKTVVFLLLCKLRILNPSYSLEILFEKNNNSYQLPYTTIMPVTFW